MTDSNVYCNACKVVSAHDVTYQTNQFLLCSAKISKICNDKICRMSPRLPQ